MKHFPQEENEKVNSFFFKISRTLMNRALSCSPAVYYSLDMSLFVFWGIWCVWVYCMCVWHSCMQAQLVGEIILLVNWQPH